MGWRPLVSVLNRLIAKPQLALQSVDSRRKHELCRRQAAREQLPANHVCRNYFSLKRCGIMSEAYHPDGRGGLSRARNDTHSVLTQE